MENNKAMSCQNIYWNIWHIISLFDVKENTVVTLQEAQGP